jgi:peroxiredoxin
MADSLSGVWELSLPGTDGQHHSLSSLAGIRATVVIFAGNGCPTVRAYEDRLMALQRVHEGDGIQVILINANNPHLSPPDTLPEMIKRAAERKFNFPYLKDADGGVAKALGANCTPHAFVLDSAKRVAYSGRIDDSRMGDRITRKDLENAIDDLVADRPVSVPSTDPFGCSIVW